MISHVTHFFPRTQRAVHKWPASRCVRPKCVKVWSRDEETCACHMGKAHVCISPPVDEARNHDERVVKRVTKRGFVTILLTTPIHRPCKPHPLSPEFAANSTGFGLSTSHFASHLAGFTDSRRDWRQHGGANLDKSVSCAARGPNFSWMAPAGGWRVWSDGGRWWYTKGELVLQRKPCWPGAWAIKCSVATCGRQARCPVPVVLRDAVASAALAEVAAAPAHMAGPRRGR